MRRVRIVLIFCALVAAVDPAAADGTKRANNLLRLLKKVDGATSGLDADFLRGMSPAAIQQPVRDEIPNRSVQAFAAAVYRREASKAIPAGGCPGPGVDLDPLTVIALCDDDNDVLLSCAFSNPGLIVVSSFGTHGCDGIACDFTNGGFTSKVTVVCLGVP